MAIIVVEFADILGESTVTGFAEKVDALAIRDAIEVAAPRGSGRMPSSRTVGQSRHSDIELTRYKDRASPKLAQACSSGQNLGEVKVHLFRTIEQGLVTYMTYTLAQTFVSRIEHETLDDSGAAFRPHVGWTPPGSGTTTPSPTLGVAGLMASGGLGASAPLAPLSMAPSPRGIAVNAEIERVWLNAASIRWTYIPYTHGAKGGAVEKGWNIQQGVEL